MANDEMRQHLAYMIASINRQLEDEIAEKLRPEGIPLEQLRILEILHDQCGRSMGEIAAQAFVERATLTRIIDRMVSEGLVLRRLDVEDRRRVLIVIARSGAVLLRRLRPMLSAQETRLSAQLQAEKTDALRTLLKSLLDQKTAGTPIGSD